MWWNNIPKSGDKYVLCTDVQKWYDFTFGKEIPAVITVEEVLADYEFEVMNKQLVQNKIDEVELELFLSTGVNDPVFQRVPCLFFGKIYNDELKDAIAFNPGPTNLQPVNSTLYIPKQFGPKSIGGEDIFEKRIDATLGQPLKFVDDWDLYHRQQGEVHCGSNVKRELPTYNWWEKL